MKVFISTTQNPIDNLALEAWALKNVDTSQGDYLFLYVNKPSVIIGRNQNLFEEVNLQYCKKNKIEIARRISGGGTVFHDLGNLNWTFISQFDTAKVNRYEWAANTIIDLLKFYGLKAYLTPRNAIEVDGLKLSGQAQFTNRKNILSHGTLLVNSNLTYLQKAIEIDSKFDIQSKASKSHRSQTANLNSFLKSPITLDQLLNDLLGLKDVELVDWVPAIEEIEMMSGRDWLYGRSPSFQSKHTIKGEVFSFQINKGIIDAIKDEKGNLLQSSPFLNQTYEKCLMSFID